MRQNVGDGSAGATRLGKPIRTIERALNILGAFSYEEPEFRLAELSRRVKLNKSTTSRILAILGRHNYVSRDLATQKYCLGFTIVERAYSVVDSGLLLSDAVEQMTRLRDKTGETVSLHIRIGSERLCIREVDSLHDLRLTLGVGRRCPIYAGATGRVLLAGMPDSALLELLQKIEFRQIAANTITGLDQLRKAIADVRRQGFATSTEERVSGGASVSAPVFNSAGRTVAALTLLGPIARLTWEWLIDHAELVKESALDISAGLGFRPN